MKSITDPDPQTSLPLDDQASNFRRLMKKTRWISVISALGCVVIFGGGGYCLDLALDKKNFWTIIGLVVGFVVMNIVSVILSRKMIESERSAQAN